MSRMRQTWEQLQLADVIVLTYWLTMLLLQLINARAIVESQSAGMLAMLVVADLVMVGTVLALAYASRHMLFPRRLTLRAVPIFLTFYFGFMLLPYYAMAVHPATYEAELIAFESWAFGGRIFSEWLEPYLVAGVTDFVQICYASHYLLPFILLGLLLGDGKNEAAEWLAAAVAIVVFLDFTLYILVPARSPYVIARLPDLRHLVSFQGPVPMGEFGNVVRDWLHQNETFRYDCFPSGHTHLSLTVLIGSWRYHRKSFIPFLVVISGLIWATLYLRYHYVIDLVVGAALAYLGWLIVPRAVALWNQKGETHADREAAVDLS